MSEPAINVVSVGFVSLDYLMSCPFEHLHVKELQIESLHDKVLNWAQTSISSRFLFRQPRMASAIASLTAGLTPQQLEVVKDQNHDSDVYAYAAVFSILAILAVIVRVTSRHMKKVAIGIDDVLVFVALVSIPTPLGLKIKYISSQNKS